MTFPPPDLRALPAATRESVTTELPAGALRPSGVARHLPSIQGSVVADRIYRGAILFFALCIPILLLLIFVEVGRAGWPALREFGFDFLTSSTWDPVKGQF